MSEKIISFFLGLACLVFLAVGGFLYVTSDRKGPEIEFSKEITTYEEGDDISILLEGVKAYDEVDGDVSDTLIIESILKVGENEYKVVYAARDKSNNVTKAETAITYTGNEVIETSKNIKDVEVDNKEKDDKDKKEEKKDSKDEKEGESKEEDVINDDDSELVSTGSPLIRLNKYEVYLKVGDSFNYMNYVKDVADDVDDDDALYRSMHVDGTPDMTKPGTYEAKYYVTDSSGNQSNVEMLKVIVQ